LFDKNSTKLKISVNLAFKFEEGVEVILIFEEISYIADKTCLEAT